MTDPKVRDALAKAFQRRYPRRNVQLSWEGYGWGVRVVNKVQRGAVVMATTADEAILAQNAYNLDPDLKRWSVRNIRSQGKLESFEDTLLGMYLLIEKAKGPESDWADYIAMLPTSFTTPGWFGDHEAACLPPFLQRARKEQRDRWNDRHRLALQLTQELPTFAAHFLSGPPTFEGIRWADSILQTRQFQFDHSGKGLYPWLDMANNEPNTALPAGEIHVLAQHQMSKTLKADTSSSPRSQRGNGPVSFIAATKNMEPGDEVHDVYGFSSLQDIFSIYGYVPTQPSLVSVDFLVEPPLRFAGDSDPAPVCGNMKSALMCLTDAETKVLVGGPEGWSAQTITGLTCQRFLPHKDLQKALAKCTNTESYTAAQPQKVLKEAVISTIQQYEADEERCREFKGGHFPLIMSMMGAALAGLRAALKKTEMAEMAG